MPAALEARTRHGVEVLLAGLGLEPAWVRRDDLAGGGLYYGTSPEGAAPGALRLRLADATAEAFAGPPALDPAAVSALEWNGTRWPLLFPTGRTFGPPDGGIEEADVVASAFAWTSGWLEDGVAARDLHGRLRDVDAPTAAVAAARPDLADPTLSPPVDAYRGWLGAALTARGVDVPGRSWGGHAWAVVPTVDVDLVRTRSLAALAGHDPRRQGLAELAGLLDGPGATAFLMAGATAAYDVPYALDHPALTPVWQSARRGRLEIGLHPSYFAHDHPLRLAEERRRLAAAAARHGVTTAAAVRTHFLRWTEPGTPRALAGAGFALDASLGFAQRAGFRRGAATPFRLFDRTTDRPLDVWAVPLVAMDTALFVHRRLSPGAARESLATVLDGARRAGGCAVLLWHNEPLGEGHLDVLRGALDAARDGGAFVGPLASAVAVWVPERPTAGGRP